MARDDAQKHSVVVTVGDELLRGHTLDTNTNWLGQRLYSVGFPVRRAQIVAHVGAESVPMVRAEIARQPDCLFLCGGLGPTPDDRTVAALAAAVDRPLHLDPTAARRIQDRIDWLHGIGRIKTNEMRQANRRMALVPEGSVILENS